MKTQVAVTKEPGNVVCVLTNEAGDQLTMKGVTNAELWHELAKKGVTPEVAQAVAEQLQAVCNARTN